MASQRGRSKQMAVDVPARKRRAAQRTASVSRVRPAVSSSDAIPGWDTLTKAAPRKPKRAESAAQPSMTTARFALWLTGIALCATLYVGHVHATQRLYESLHALKKHNLQLHLSLDQLKGELDRAAGPAVLYPKARRLGLEEGFGFGPTIRLQK